MSDPHELNGPTLGEVYRLQVALKQEFKSLGDKMEGRVDHLEQRVNTIEVRSAFISGSVAVLVGVIKAVWPFGK